MPTPVQGHQMFSMGSNLGGVQSPPLLMQAGQGGAGGDGQQPAMAFTYVPVPVYNIGGMGMPMMPGKTNLDMLSHMESNDWLVGSGLPSMNYSSMGMMNTSTGSASPNKQQGAEPQAAPAATSTPMSPGASNIRY